MIMQMLDLSTGHVPTQHVLDEMKEEGDCWGAACSDYDPGMSRPPRVAKHQYGWIVFVSVTWNEDGTVEAMEEAMNGVPKWLLPIYKHAAENECRLINFDADGPLWELEFETYDWERK